MLKCFSFRYESLKEDESGQRVGLSSSNREKKNVFTNTVVKVGKRTPKPPRNNSSSTLTNTTTTTTVSTSTNNINLPSNKKVTKHLDRQQQLQLQKATEKFDIGQRYSQFPIKVCEKSSSSISAPTNSTGVESLKISCTCGGVGEPIHLLWSKMPRNADWSRNGSFFNKPSRGWLHPSKQLADGGISYSVRYVGRLDVNASMKSLDFETRSQVAKECINRICEVAGLKTADRKRRVDKKIIRMLGDKPNMEYAGSNVNLRISSAYLKLIVMESDEVIASHDMPNVSFASGGDPETLDFVSYVAKDNNNERACYVLECGGGLAQDVITTIGQAFELRFKEYLKRAPKPRDAAFGTRRLNDDPEYYNDLPGKIPPETTLPAIPPWPDYQNENKWTDQGNGRSNGENKRRDSVDNLIDLSSEPSSPLTKIPAGPEYVNDCVAEALGHHSGAMGYPVLVADPFDMQPLEENLPDTPSDNLDRINGSLHSQLAHEDWFHGCISRKTAEALLVNDGDFLVRESRGSPGQFVLSGVHRDNKKHLLLVDPEGVVRTKDKKFSSVSHLVEYHRSNRLPIISAESAMVLLRPVSRTSSTSVRMT